MIPDRDEQEELRRYFEGMWSALTAYLLLWAAVASGVVASVFWYLVA
jgi:hypothetical protein